LAQCLYDITPLEPLIKEGYILLTPNYRLARRIKAEWDARRRTAGERVWEPLLVQPLESWLIGQWERAVSEHYLPPVTPLGPAQALELWRQIIVQQQMQSSDYLLLRPAAAAELASRARDTLRRWQVDVDTPVVRQSFELEQDCDTFMQWLKLFEQRLAESRQCTTVDCLLQLSALRGIRRGTKVALLEFVEIAPLERAILRALCEHLLEINVQAAPAERLLHSFSDKRAEMQAVAAWAAGLHREKPTETIAIVLSNLENDRVALEYLLRREFECLGENYNSLPVNFSTGIALVQAPLIRDALAVLAMGLQYTTVPAIIALLHSRFLLLPDAQSALSQQFIQRLYVEGREIVETSDLRNTAMEISLGEEKGLVLGRYLLVLHEMRNLRHTAQPSIWAARFSEVLSLWGWPGNGALDSLEYQQLEQWYKTLDTFKAYDAVCQRINFADALQLLRECCSLQVSQPQTADGPIHVLGPLEAAGLAFEHLWLCGMQSTRWPPPPGPNPFIPSSLQLRLKMPHASPEREWEFSQALLEQYARCSTTLHASFCRQVDGVPELPSALLQNFTPREMPELPVVAQQWTSIYAEGMTENIPDYQAPSLDSEQQFTFSGGSSLLEDQSRCPFRTFARHRLRVEPLDAFSVGPSAADRGSLTHAALFALWGEISDSSALRRLSDVEQEQTIGRAVEAAVSSVPYYRLRQLGRAYWQLERQRMASLLTEWLAVERQRSAFSVVRREQDIRLQLAQLHFKLRVDRIDEMPDGSRVIIDYKSGTCTVQDLLGDRPSRPQLLLYGYAEPDNPAALAFAQVQSRNCRYVGLGRIAPATGISTDIARAAKSWKKAVDWPTLNQRWREILERLATEFVAGEAQVDPVTSSACDSCGLQSLCRVEMAGTTVDERAS
jgi:ATP-dependent helicase/nuclease subunit B